MALSMRKVKSVLHGVAITALCDERASQGGTTPSCGGKASMQHEGLMKLMVIRVNMCSKSRGSRLPVWADNKAEHARVA